jgi:hypothetical protein
MMIDGSDFILFDEIYRRLSLLCFSNHIVIHTLYFKPIHAIKDCNALKG